MPNFRPLECWQVHRSNRGWSLVELMVTVGILIVLVAVGLPALQSARSVSNQMVCSSRLRNVAMAGTSWIMDHDGAMLDAMFWRFPSETHSGSILPYLGYKDSLLNTRKATPLSCPSSLQEVGPNPDWNRCYSVNVYACMSENGVRSGMFERQASRIQQLTHPSEMAFFMDGNFLSSGSAERKVGTANVILPWNEQAKTGFYARHRGKRANVAFFDGHVAAMTLEEFPQGTDLQQRTSFFWGSLQ